MHPSRQRKEKDVNNRIAINGFGRIGRLVFRHLMDMEALEVVAINDLAPLDNFVYLLKHDSVHTDPPITIEAHEDTLHWGDRSVRYTAIREPENLPWDELDVGIAIEATGRFTKRKDAARHLAAGAGRVIVTAPAQDADTTIVLGVNEDTFDPGTHMVISNASCTTNCLAPVARVLDEKFGIVTGFLTTVHAYTSSQALVDAPSRKWRRGRSAAVSIVPTTTGAAVATTLVLPRLKGKLDGLAMRVPVPAGSIIDFVVQTEKQVTVEAVNEALRQASRSDRLKGILGVSEEELVSADIVDSNYSSLVDLQSTMTLGKHTAKVLAWYDNEWGYARRVAELARYIAQHSSSRTN
jgi:glyceraldehyde 3-phosphate dehydrogenase